MTDRRALRGALLAVVLAGGVLFGLLGMHALGLHGTAGAHGPGHAAVVATASHRDAAHDRPGSAAHDRGDRAAPLASHEGSTPPSHDLAAALAAPSAGGTDGAAACVLALLGGLLLLLRHRASPAPVAPAATVVLRARGTLPIPRPPSLHVLCISRT